MRTEIGRYRERKPTAMFSIVLYAATIVLVALVMGASFSHALEMPPKMAASGQFWVSCQHTLYRYYRFIAGPGEIAAVLITAAFSYLDVGRPGFSATLIAAVGLILALIVWLVATEPANRQIATWKVDDLPANWTKWRTQWEYSHITRFVLHLIALLSLLIGVLIGVRQAQT